MLSMCENYLLVGWAWAETGYSLAEHTRKLVTRWLSICGNLFLLVLNHVFPCHTLPCPLVPFSCPLSKVLYVSCLKCLFLVSHPLFPVSRLCSLFPVHCSLSHVAVPYLPSSVPGLTSLFHISRPLSPILCSMPYFFIPCLPSSVPCLPSLFLVSHPLFPILRLCSLSPVLFPNLKSLFLVSPSLFPILRLCSLYPILLSRQFVALYWFSVCSACDKIVSEYAQCDEFVSEYAQCVMNSFPHMLSVLWNSFRVW